jgi:serine/threonine protein kinase
MTIPAGTKLGTYEITSHIGSGGMGEVYQAHDSKLGRDVAIKVLPQQFASDPERLARFQREAKMLAALNHPNIATIHGLEQSGNTHYLVMELVPGETLAERIRGGAIPIDEALPIARQVADAVEYAHDKNVIHRDLKPANIKATAEGTVKVLDFGLAKAMSDEVSEGDMSNSPTLSMAATRQDESGSYEVYVQSFPAGGGKWQVSTHGGVQPHWRHDGKELFYLAPDSKMMSVTVKAGTTFEAGTPEPLFQTRIYGLAVSSYYSQQYDVTPDGQRFLLDLDASDVNAAPLTVVLDWTAGLQK